MAPAGHSDPHPTQSAALQPSLSLLWHRTTGLERRDKRGLREVSQGAQPRDEGACPRQCSLTCYFQRLRIPGMFSARWTSRPPSHTQKARAKAAARAALAGTRQASSAHLLHGPRDSAGKSKQRNYVASLGFQKTQLATGWRMPWAWRPELCKMRDTKEGTKRPTLTLTVACARPWVRPQHPLLGPRLPPVFRGVQPFFLALAGCPGAAQGP